VISADQWSQTYYQFREGKLYLVENDNKEQQHTETELDISAFVRRHGADTGEPYVDMVSFLTDHVR
jgi:hypothetical protein